MTMAEGPGPSRTAKSPAAFRTISEVGTALDVPQHVLRFWETKFTQVRPMKRAGGRRYYRPEDIALLRRIRGLLYDDGYTIRGVQRPLREGGVKGLLEDAPSTAAPEVGASADPPSRSPLRRAKEGARAGPSLDAELRRELRQVVDELTALRDLLRAPRK